MTGRNDSTDTRCWLGGLLWRLGPVPLEAPWPWAHLCITEDALEVGPSGILSTLTVLGTMPTLCLELKSIERVQAVREPYPFGLMGGIRIRSRGSDRTVTFTRPTSPRGRAIRSILDTLDRHGVPVDRNVQLVLPWRG